MVEPVRGLVCEGLNFLVGGSKIGKSWLVLDMCLCVAGGLPFLGRATAQGEVLYLALEDGDRRLQSRLKALGRPIPPGFYYATQAEQLAGGFLEVLAGWLGEHPHVQLVVVDTFQKIRGVSRGNLNAYENDYEVVGRLKRFADSRRIALLLVHHTNKPRGVGGDPFDRVSGSTGTLGAADNLILITRDRKTNVAQVNCQGRDIGCDPFQIRFEGGRWSLLTGAYQEEQRRLAYEGSRLAAILRALAREFPQGHRLLYTELLAYCRERHRFDPAPGPRQLAGLLAPLAEPLERLDGVRLELGLHTRRGTALRLSIPGKGQEGGDGHA